MNTRDIVDGFAIFFFAWLLVVSVAVACIVYHDRRYITAKQWVIAGVVFCTLIGLWLADGAYLLTHVYGYRAR